MFKVQVCVSKGKSDNSKGQEKSQHLEESESESRFASFINED